MSDNSVETTEITQPPEALENQFRKTTVVYHGASDEHSRAKSIPLFGLFGPSDRVTISTDLGTSTIYGRREGRNLLVTIWHPNKQDFSAMPYTRRDVPTPSLLYLKRNLTAEEKGNIRSQIEASQISEDDKGIIVQTLAESSYMLPPDRLGAVISFSDTAPIFGFTKLLASSGLELYTKDREKLREGALMMLKQAKTEYLEPGLTLEMLADNMVRSAVEHELLSAGYHLQDNIRHHEGNYWENWKSRLEQVTFSEPVYERYRLKLLNKFAKNSTKSWG